MIKSKEEEALQQKVDTICKAYNEGMLSRSDYKSLVNKFKDRFEESMVISTNGDVRHCLKLKEDGLEKSFKYLRREGSPGNYKYFYEEPKEEKDRLDNEDSSIFGKIYKNINGTISDCIDKILTKKSGQVSGAFNLKLPVVITDNSGKQVQVVEGGKKVFADTEVDLVWESNEKDKKGNIVKRGLKHILRRHFVEQSDFSSIKELKESIQTIVDEAKDGESKSIGWDGDAIVIQSQNGDRLIIKVVELRDSQNGIVAYKHYVMNDYFVADERVNKVVKSEKERQKSWDIINNYTKEPDQKIIKGEDFSHPLLGLQESTLQPLDSSFSVDKKGNTSLFNNPFSDCKYKDYISNEQIFDEESFQKGSEDLENELEKGKKAQIGETMEWGGEKTKKEEETTEPKEYSETVFTEYKPEDRANAELGDNIATPNLSM